MVYRNDALDRGILVTKLNRIIWTCWFQGQESAPEIVKRCLKSWVEKNPGWEFRCLDAYSVEEYVNIKEYIKLNIQEITAASLSDIVRILLLHEYGGVWVDATLFCSQPLDNWLPEKLVEGFFAFARPAPDRPLSSWFLASAPGNRLVSQWCGATLRYWDGRSRADSYFWFHYLFKELCASDEEFGRSWQRVPHVSADGPHSIQTAGMYEAFREVSARVDWASTVYKLTYRVEVDKIKPDSLLASLLSPIQDTGSGEAETTSSALLRHVVPRSAEEMTFASLKVSTENLGDHIQILAGEHLFKRFGVRPQVFLDRDDEIRSAPVLEGFPGPVPILMNGWFKRNGTEWPPNGKLLPIFIGFHIRLFQSPELLSDESIEYFKRFQPIGCRDIYTEMLLRGKGVETYESNCLSLTLDKRIFDGGDEIFVVSRDRRIIEFIPERLGPFTFRSHYTGSNDFENNMRSASDLLNEYKSRAKLIVTSLLHCALPAIAMGIPVVVIYPVNDQAGHASDRERFSSLERLTRIYHIDQLGEVDWEPKPIDVGMIKLALHDCLKSALQALHMQPSVMLGPIASSDMLPPP
ncbi:capsular polysaccharide synthesis protein [Mesorhizobium sp. M0496]|uniref:capsular polysaccharide synthesis protein n=1 Tax=Mesorhizobium sp. M0496 TaxID=2956952 RepID=UPI00333A6347